MQKKESNEPGLQDLRRHWKLSVVVVTHDINGKRTHKDFHMISKNCRESVMKEFRNEIAGKGFRADGKRYWPDQIESLNYIEIEKP